MTTKVMSPLVGTQYNNLGVSPGETHHIPKGIGHWSQRVGVQRVDRMELVRLGRSGRCLHRRHGQKPKTSGTLECAVRLDQPRRKALWCDRVVDWALEKLWEKKPPENRGIIRELRTPPFHRQRARTRNPGDMLVARCEHKRRTTRSTVRSVPCHDGLVGLESVQGTPSMLVGSESCVGVTVLFESFV